MRWDGVDVLAYKRDSDAPFRDVTRQILFDDPMLACQLRYFEVAPGGHTTLERHEHAHAVMVARGHGECLVGDRVYTIAERDLVHVPPLTWHQFRADADAPLGFLCMVNGVRDRPQLPTAEDLELMSRDPAIARFIARSAQATHRPAVNTRRRIGMAKLNINGKTLDVAVEADTPLLWVIREQVGLTGTKYGCGVAQCGACSVHFNGEVARSCAIPVGSVKPTDRIVTIEGLSATSSHPVQKAWAKAGRSAVRLLPVGADHGRGSAVAQNPEPHRRRDRRRHDQHLPLRHVSARADGRARGGPHRGQAEVGVRRCAYRGP